MEHQTNTQTNHQFRRLPKGERRVRFADSMGMELVSIFLFDLINQYYFASIHNHKQLPAPRQAPIHRSSHKPALSLKPPTLASNQFSSSTRTNSVQDTRANTLHYDHYHHHEQQQKQHQQQQQHHQQQLHPPQSNNQNKHLSQSQQHQQVASQSFNPQQEPIYVCEFTQPISLISFKERVRLNKVHLETCSVLSRAGQISLSCTIRVLNEAYDKEVIVRYTTDEWHTSTDSLAAYRPTSCDGWSDKFSSTISLASKPEANQRIIFAIRFASGGQVFWDNNGGLNYSVGKV